LEFLYLNSNQLWGRLPQSLTNLHALTWFCYDTALLCAPANAAFQAWLTGIPDKCADSTTCKTSYLPALLR
jgi:hypothetical protein